MCGDKIRRRDYCSYVCAVHRVRSVVRPVSGTEKSFEVVGFRPLRAFRTNRTVVSVNGDDGIDAKHLCKNDVKCLAVVFSSLSMFKSQIDRVDMEGWV